MKKKNNSTENTHIIRLHSQIECVETCDSSQEPHQLEYTVAFASVPKLQYGL